MQLKVPNRSCGPPQSLCGANSGPVCHMFDTLHLPTLLLSCFPLCQINMKTMPAVMFRLLTGQETPVYI